MDSSNGLSKLNAINIVALPQPAVVLNESSRFDTAIDKYISHISEDMELFNLGPYNKRERTNAISFQALAALHCMVEALLTWCPSCTPSKQFLTDHPTFISCHQHIF